MPAMVGVNHGDVVIRDTAIVDNDSVVTDSQIIGLGPEAGDAELVNVLLANNSSELPVINANNAGASTELMNVTVAGNEVSGERPHVVAAQGPLAVTNCIVWGRTSPRPPSRPARLMVSFS